MEHSIAAKYAARPAAHFVRPSARIRERRLGLHPLGAFRAAAERATILRQPDVAPLVRLRARWRSIQPATVSRPADGRPRPQVVMVWARSVRPGAVRRAGASAAPWRA